MEITKNQAACAALALLAATATGNVFAAMATASKVSSLVYGVLGIIYTGVSIASITAWLDKEVCSASDYFDAFRSNLEFGISQIYQRLPLN